MNTAPFVREMVQRDYLAAKRAAIIRRRRNLALDLIIIATVGFTIGCVAGYFFFFHH